MGQAVTIHEGTAIPDGAEEGASVPRRRRRPLGLLLGGILGAVLIGGALTGSRSLDLAPPIIKGDGQLAAAFNLENVHGTEPEVSLSDYRGRPVVLNFWASWCVPCRREMPALAAVHRASGDRIAFVGVNHRDGRIPALALLEETGLDYPSAFDPEGSVAFDYGLYGMPTTAFIAPDGELLELRTGEISQQELAMTIDRLFPA